MGKRVLDKDGDPIPEEVWWVRHEAWLWDTLKEIRYKGTQKASPMYRPTRLQLLFDILILRWLYFRSKPGVHPTRLEHDAVDAALRAQSATYSKTLSKYRIVTIVDANHQVRYQHLYE